MKTFGIISSQPTPSLFMGLDEPGIDHSNFGNHRERLMRNKLDILYLDRFTRLMYYLGILTGKEPFLNRY